MGLVRSYEPFKNGANLLRALHDLDIKDKHRMIIRGSFGYVPPSVKARGVATVSYTLKDGTSRTDDEVLVQPKLIMIDGFQSEPIITEDRSHLGVKYSVTPSYYLSEDQLPMSGVLKTSERFHKLCELIVEQVSELASATAKRH